MGEIDVRIRMAVEEDRKKTAEWLLERGHDLFRHNPPVENCTVCNLVAALEEGNAPWEA